MNHANFRGTFPAAFLLLFVVLGSCTPPPPDSQTGDVPGVVLRETTPPWVMEGGIYELFVRNFTPEGTFRAIIPQLPRLKALGVETIWLMPIHPIGQENRKGTFGSPYSVKNYRDVDPAYGTLEDFRVLVEEIHAQDMHVILDWVANHTAWDHPWTKEHPEWYTQDAQGKIVPPVEDWWDVADLNYDNQEMRASMIGAMTWWVRKLDVDGFRIDTASMVPPDFWQEALQAVRSIKPAFFLAEGDDPDLLDAGFDMLYAWPGYASLKKLWPGSANANSYPKKAVAEWQAANQAPVLRFVTNHDETSWDQTPVDLFGGPEGSRAAALATFLLPGIPLIYNGQELASDVEANLFEKTLYDWKSSRETQEFYGKLQGLWAREDLLKTGGVDIRDTKNFRNLMSFAREDGKNRIVVVVNTRSREEKFTLPEEWSDRSYEDLWTGSPWTGPTALLPAYGWLILKSTGE